MGEGSRRSIGPALPSPVFSYADLHFFYKRLTYS